jgi:hypothetical protein
MKRTRYEPDQYADLLISEIGNRHFQRKGDFLHLGIHRELIICHFSEALQAAFDDGKRVGKHQAEEDAKEA